MTKQRAGKAAKADKKVELRHISFSLIGAISKAMGAGAIKYSNYNYLMGHTQIQLIEAAIRHLFLALHGEKVDADCSRLLGEEVTHLGCAGANLNMIHLQQEAGTSHDDTMTPKARAYSLLNKQEVTYEKGYTKFCDYATDYTPTLRRDG